MSGYDVANDPANSMNSITDAKLLNNVKNSKGEPILNSSKVVDENGEPMVMYHGTPNEFNAFSVDKIGTSTDDGVIGKGFY